MHRNGPRPCLREIARPLVGAGVLAEAFRSKVPAVVVHEDPRIHQLWSGVMESELGESQFPWEQTLQQVARNHQPRNMNLGDMLRFVRSSFSQIARKVLFAPVDGRMRVFPALRSESAERCVPSDELLWLAWEVMSELLTAALPSGAPAPRFAVSMDLLKYPAGSKDLDEILELLADSGAEWTRLGRQLDAYKYSLSLAFDHPVIPLRDWLALASLVPTFRRACDRLDAVLKRAFDDEPAPGWTIIGAPHIDDARVLTALVGDRDIVRTEVRTGGQWVELPITVSSVAVFPGVRLRNFADCRPTLHRVLMREDVSTRERPNVSLTFGIVDERHAMQLCPEYQCSA